MTTRQRSPRDDLIFALHAEIVRSTHEVYELRDLLDEPLRQSALRRPEHTENRADVERAGHLDSIE